MFLLTWEACAGSVLVFFPLDSDKRNDTGTAETRRKVKRLLAVSCIIYFKVDLLRWGGVGQGMPTIYRISSVV